MSDFDKNAFREQLEQLAEGSTDHLTEIKKAIYAPKKVSLPWWHWRGVPMRAAALCCSVALVITGTFLWWPRQATETTGAPQTENFSSLTDDIFADTEEEQPENNGSTSHEYAVNESLSGSTTAPATSVSASQSRGEDDTADALPSKTPEQQLEGTGNWTLTTTTATLTPTPEQWSVRSKAVSGTGFVRWQETASLGAIAAATPRVPATFGSFGTRLAKRVLVTLENGASRAAGITVILNDANGKPLCQTVTAENGSAVLIYGGKKPHSLEIKQGDTTLEKLPFSETASSVSLSLELPENNASPALDLMIVAELSPQTKAALSVMSTGLKQTVTNAANGTAVSVRSAAVCYDNTITQTAFSAGTEQTTAFLSNHSFPASSVKTPSFAAALTEAISSYTWREGATKVLVLAPDTIPVLSERESEAVNVALAKAAAQGVRVVTLAHADTDTDTELLLRALSFGTGGEFVFRAAESGNGTVTAKPLGTVLTAVLTDLLKKG